MFNDYNYDNHGRDRHDHGGHYPNDACDVRGIRLNNLT
jgi:hypothetical protein